MKSCLHFQLKSFIVASVIGIISTHATASIEGTWRTFDEQTKAPKALIQIKQTADHRYTGTYIKALNTPKFTTCQNCPAPFTGQAIQNMVLLWDLKADAKKPQHFSNGKIIDPTTGKIYKANAELSADEKTLKLRGFIGVSLLGRTQVWQRDAP